MLVKPRARALLGLIVGLLGVTLACSGLAPASSGGQDPLRPTVEGLAAQNADLSTRVAALATANARQDTIISHLATQIPPRSGDASSGVPTPTPYLPVLGAVEIEEGRCCAGGVAGDTIPVAVAFEARSPVTGIEEMRVRTGMLCFGLEDMAEAEWEPFQARKSYDVPVPINWTGFYVSVQYRDAEGNLSPVVCDDISIEGHSPTPTPE
jgi:hypothetical protein